MVSQPIIEREISDYCNPGCRCLAEFEAQLHGIEAKPQYCEMHEKAKPANQREQNKRIGMMWPIILSASSIRYSHPISASNLLLPA